MTPAAIAIASGAVVLIVVVAVRAVRGALDADKPLVPPLTDAEREAEGRENGLQLRYAHGEHGVRVDWIRALREERAQTDALIVALEQEEFAERRKRWAAPRPRGWMAS
jgi:hypothetical protein